MRPPDIHIRAAHAGDAPILARLAELDSRPAPGLPALLALVDGEAVAAYDLAAGAAVGDPFRPTADVLRLLELRADAGRRPAHHGRLGAALRRLVATPRPGTA
jgi:hypothetical protein